MASLNDIANRTANLENNKANINNPLFYGKMSIIQDSDSIVFNTSTKFVGVGGAIYAGKSLGFWHSDCKSGAALVSNGDWVVDNGNITGNKIYNAVWNDYAEFYERGEHTEPGDIIGLNPNSDKEEYIKATNPSMCVGVHSDEYGHLIGGEKAPEGKDFVEYNIDKFIPVGLVGRVKTKIIGKISIGDKIVLSDIPGVGRKFIKGIDDSENIIGMAVENKTDESISRIRAHLRMGGGELILNFIGSNPHCEVIQ